MFSRVRRALLKIFAFALLFWIAIGIVATKLARDSLEKQRSELSSAFSPHLAEFRKDIEHVSRNPRLVRREGDDASKLILEHVRIQKWDGNSMTLSGAAPLPPSFEKTLNTGSSDWTEHLDAPELVGLDLSWLKELSRFGYWDWEPLGEVMPSDSDLRVIARARLLVGLRDGDILGAIAELHELERLALTTERFGGVYLSIMLQQYERAAWTRATKLGLDVSGWTPPSQEDGERFSRAWLASTELRSLLATGAMTTQDLGPFQCCALASGLEEAHFYSRYLERPLRERYAQLNEELAKSPCRLQKERRRLNQSSDEGRFAVSTRAFCPGGPEVIYPPCELPEVSLAWLPFIRLPLGVLFLSNRHRTQLAHFKGYAHPTASLAPDAGVAR